MKMNKDKKLTCIRCKKVLVDYLKDLLKDSPYKHTEVMQASYDYWKTHNIPEDIIVKVNCDYLSYLEGFSERINVAMKLYLEDLVTDVAISNKMALITLCYLEKFKEMFGGDFVAYAKEKLTK